MMSKLRSFIVWSVIGTQLWSPVLAQTLPISVDKSVAGQKPVVGTSNGVPVINIAPPSAGGVSNNRYTQFNVGPSGVVLNNSGGASQTQLAGQIAGNVMLGNQRAATILNQVTAPNPSRLMGTLEVAGNRANVIVANPAGITCNGCGFLNADRATLTTGRPQVGPDGNIALDVAAGRIRVEGEGLYGANLSQVDLIARSLEINAGVWADRLNVTAGAARVDYASGAVSARAGEGAAPAVALDTAALGGMYANSIRLIGTEAGVGVNVGGNLAALTGDLHVSAAGDVRIAPGATVQAARDLRLAAGRDLAVDGAAQAAGAVALAAGRNADIQGAVGAGGPASVDAAGNVAIAAQAGLQTQGALRIAAGQDLSLAGSMLMGGQDLRAESGRNLRIGPAAATPGGTPPATGGSGQGPAAGGGSDAGGSGSGAAGGHGANGGVSNASGGPAQAGAGSGGQVTAAGAIALQAGRDMTLPGRITAAGALQARAGADLAAGASAQLQSGAATALRAGADLSLGGLVGARGDVSLMAGRDALLSGKGAGTGRVAMAAGRDLRLDAPAQWDAEGAMAAKAGGNMALAGTLRANAGTDIAADGALAIDGALSAASGGLSATAGGDLSLGAQAQVAAAGPVGLTAGGDLRSLGKLTSQKDLSLRAARNLALDGQALATGDLRLDAGDVLAASSASRLQADGSVKAEANQASLAGVLIAGQAAQVVARGNLRVDGTLLADAGTLKAISGGDLTLGGASVLQSGGQLDARAGGKLLADGTISGETDILLSAGTDAELNGKTVANGTLRAEAGADLAVGQAGLAQGSGRLFLDAGRDLRVAGTAGTADTADAEGVLQARAARDLFVTGVVTAGTPASLSAARHMGIDGTVAALAGNLAADAGGQLRVGAAGRMQASHGLAAQSGGDLDSDGVIVAGGGLTLAAAGDARLGGTAAALGDTSAGNVELRARDLTVKQGGQAQAAGTLTARALRDLTAAGALASVRDMALDAARDARVDGTAATDANLTLTGRNVAVGAAGLAQAAGALTAGAQDTLLAQGRMLAGASQALSAGDGMVIDGTVAALQGDLTLDTLRGNLALGAASSQQAGGTLAATAGAALQAMGSAAAGQGMTLRAGTDATLGGIAATQAGNLVVNANRNLTATADGRLQAAGALDLQAGAALRNAGILSASGAASLRAGSTLDNTGSVLAGGDVNATALGALGNAGRLIAGVGDDGALSLPGSVKLTAAFITHPGISAAGKDLSLAAAGMDLSGGNLSAVGKLALASPGDIATRNAVVHGGTLDIAAANLRNQGGKLTSAGDAALKLGGELDNAAGLIAAAGGLRIEAGRVGNAAGTLAGADVAIAATGAVDNRGGLIQADESLTLNAAALDNSATLAAPGAPAKGVLGKLVAIMADRVNNQGGSVGAGQDLTLTTGELDNTGGEVAAQRNATVRAALLKNAQGQLLAGERLAVNVDALQGLGTLHSAQDLSFTYAGSLNQTGNIAAGRDLTLSVGGAMDNSASVSAGRDLSVTADSLNNRATGELLAGRNNTLNVAHGLTNAGLIDGASTNINAGRLDNFGRIYGNAISIRAGEIVNGAGAGGGAVIASRGDLDLGAGSLVNREHALIYAGADLRIGGALDANRKAIGQAVSLLNASATIEAAGNAAISAATLQNVNTNFVSQTVPVRTVPKLYVTPAGTTDMYDMETNWFCDQVTALCGKVPAWLDDDPERRFLLPSTTYPASRYGPPFDYVPSKKGRAGETAPIPVTYTPEIFVCTGGEGGADCRTDPETFFYPSDSRIWAVFGVTAPPGPMPVWVPPQRECFGKEACAAEAARRQAYEDAYAAYKASHLELDSRIRAFNADFDSRLVGTFTYYQVEETVSETRTVSSDPAKILSGGAMTLTGAVTNDKSQIAAGGALNVSGPAIHNIGAGGERVVTRVGTATYTQARSGDRKETSTPYTATLAAQPIELPVGTSGGYTSVSLSGGAPGASGGSAPGPVLVASLGLPGGDVVRTVSNPAAIPDSQLFAVNGRPDAPYIVATDPRFVGNRPTVSSDYLFDLLQQPGAPVGNAGASGSVNAGLGGRPSGLNALIPAGAKFLTPSGQPRRLGDGFYEQKLVADQILATTGQRFLEGYADNDGQYKALLAAGAQFARNNGIQLGVALTEAQQRLLDTDLVWLVEQTVTLPDGTTETVLVPQVYLLVREDDLKGDGTLMAGRSVKLAADGDIANSGTVGARDAVVMTAANIVNQAGGLIQGATVDLAAREDLTNLVSLIKGDNVSLSAGRDIALTSTSASENHGATWGSYVSGVSRVDAGNLNMQAGRDLTLTAAQVTVKDNARLQAGRDLTLATLEESHGESIVRNKNNRHDLSTSTEIGSSIAAEGNLTLIAGQDVNARAADVTAGKQLAVGAGRDINLTAGIETGSAYDETRYKTKGFLSSKTTHTITSRDWEQSLATTFTGDTAVLMAGRDLTVAGSNVGAQRDLVMSADRDVNILPGQNAEDSYDYKMVKKSGFGAMGGMSYGTSKQTDSLEGKKVFHNASTVGSVEGDVLINAGRALNIMGSNVIARQGDITLIGKEVNIGAALDTTQEKEFHEIKQTGLTLTASNPIVSAVQTGARMADAAGKTDNAVMKGLAGVTTGLAAVNAYDAVQASAKAAAAKEVIEPGSSNEIDKLGGVSIKLSLGTSKSSSTTDRNASNAFGSTVAAGRDLTIVAQGAGKDSDITVTGSNLSAGNNVVLKAEGDILLQAARNAFEQKTDSKSSSASIGIGYSTGGKQNGFTLELGASVGRGNANGRDESWTNSHITAGNVLAIQSGGDTTLKGATGRAEQIIASVGGNLLLESLQDTSKYDSKNKSAGFGVSLCVPPYCVGSSSAWANVGAGKMNSDFKSVTEQTGLWAGDGGFLIDVKNNTTLIGSVIASSDKAVADGLNKLITGTLVTEDIKNSAKYSGGQVSIGGGFGFGGGKAGDSGLGTNKDGVAGGASKDHGSSISTGSSGFGMGVPAVVAASGSGSSTTQSAISGGTIVIRDEAGQLALTGKTAAETIASLNRDTSDTLNALKPIFDKEKIEAGFEIASEAQRQAGQFLANRADEARAIKEALGEELKKGENADPDLLKHLDAEFNRTRPWAMGGDARNALTVLIAAASGNVTGSVGNFAMNAALGYLQTQGAQRVKKWADSLPAGAQSESVRTALHALLACGSAAAQGAACSSAAAGAGLSSVLGYLLATPMGGSDEDIEAKNNLLNGIVASIVGALGGQAATASAAARIEAENNTFYSNPASVSKATAKERAALEQAWDEGRLSRDAYEQALRKLDAASSKIDALLTIYNVQSGSDLSEQLGRMSDVHVAMFTEAVTGLLTFPGMAASAYELATGETAVSHEEANYFFAALGVVPGSKLGKAAEDIIDLARVLKNGPAVAAAKQIAANQAKGKSFEEAVRAYLSQSKNTASFTVNVNGKMVTVIPDGIVDAAKILEIKDVAKLSNSAQFRAYAELVESGGTVTKGLGPGNGVFKQFEGIDLIVSPGARISVPLQDLIKNSGGSIREFDLATQQLTPWIPK
ncbi:MULTISPECIES: hemagglutinin repeat-containing protein [Achromobacter]|uniref:Hemagglutinin repeat-containing protein n=1 Tax=Achromobacter denitrificans TaxID=32002 RepID=A0A6N0JIL7_ACHDE|nr:MULTISPECIES: hemagglutinin repeat-containing protein [Achromobacter]QKQ46598.1 hemagglutinin repeat-containing protein [Achromobacter denitrificans]